MFQYFSDCSEFLHTSHLKLVAANSLSRENRYVLNGNYDSRGVLCVFLVSTASGFVTFLSGLVLIYYKHCGKKYLLLQMQNHFCFKYN